jgi:tRNA dimethylallyltransferase
VPGAAGTRRTKAPPVVALFGATALGKTDIAVAVAERLRADIVVADSMQVYQGLPIVTNQPDEDQRARARHHLVGFVPPQREFTVAEYAREAHEVIDGLLRDRCAVVVEGGSGLYLRAALGDLEFAAPPDAALRRELETRWARDPEGVLADLRLLDPAGAARLDTSNSRRVIRALEAVLVSGGTLPATGRDRLWEPGERYAHSLIALVSDDDRAALNARIETRVDEMLVAGALEEVARARERGQVSRTALQAIGVRELGAVLDGELSPDEAAARMKARTRALARRQLTWMRKLPAAAQVSAGERSPDAVAKDVITLVEARPW